MTSRVLYTAGDIEFQFAAPGLIPRLSSATDPISSAFAVSALVQGGVQSFNLSNTQLWTVTPSAGVSITASGTGVNIVFPNDTVYQVSVITPLGLASKTLAINHPPQITAIIAGASRVTAPGDLLDLSPYSSTLIAVAADDGYGCIDPPSPIPFSGGSSQCLTYQWSAPPGVIVVSPNSRVTRVLSSPGVEVDPAHPIPFPMSLNVSDGQLQTLINFNAQFSGQITALTIDSVLPYGQQELAIDASAEVAIPGLRVQSISTAPTWGSVSIGNDGKTIKYTAEAGSPCAALQVLNFTAVTPNGLSVPLVVNLTIADRSDPPDFELFAQTGGTGPISKSWSLAIHGMRVITTVRSGIDMPHLSYRSPACSVPHDDYQIVGIEDLYSGTGSSPITVTSLSLDSSGNSPEIQLGLYSTLSSGATTFRLRVRTPGGTMLAWPVYVVIGADPWQGVANRTIAPIAVKLGDIFVLDSQLPVFNGTGTPTYSWSGVNLTFLDSATSASPQVVFLRAGPASATLNVSVPGQSPMTFHYSFDVSPVEITPVIAGQSILPGWDGGAGYHFAVTVVSGSPGTGTVTDVSGSVPEVIINKSGQYWIKIVATGSGLTTITKYAYVEVVSPQEAQQLGMTVDSTPFVALNDLAITGKPHLLLTDDMEHRPTITDDAQFYLYGVIQPSALAPTAPLYYIVRLRSLGDGREYSLTPLSFNAGVPVSDSLRTNSSTVLSQGVAYLPLATLSTGDLPDGEYEISIYVSATQSPAGNVFDAADTRRFRLRKPHYNGTLAFNRVELEIGSGSGALRVERSYNSKDPFMINGSGNLAQPFAPGWRMNTPLVSARLVENRALDRDTSAWLRTPDSPRDIVIQPAGSAESVRLKFYDDDVNPQWISDDGLSFAVPGPADLAAYQAIATGTVCDDVLADDGSLVFELSAQQKPALLNKFDFATVDWTAPGGTVYHFDRGNPAGVATQSFSACEFEYQIYTNPLQLSRLTLLDGTSIAVSRGGAWTELQWLPADDASAAVSRSIRFDFDGNNRLADVQDTTPGQAPLTLVSYLYYQSSDGAQLNGNLKQVTKSVQVRDLTTGNLNTITTTERYNYAVNSTFTYLVSQVVDDRNQPVLQAAYDSAGNLKYQADADGIIRGARLLTGTGTTAQETIISPYGNDTLANYQTWLSGINGFASLDAQFSAIQASGANHVVTTVSTRYNTAGLPTKITQSMPAITVSEPEAPGGQIVIPAHTKSIYRAYDDEQFLANPNSGTVSDNIGHRLMVEGVGDDATVTDTTKVTGYPWITMYQYDSTDAPTSVTRPGGMVETTAYNSAGQVTASGNGIAGLGQMNYYDPDSGQLTGTATEQGYAVTNVYVGGRLSYSLDSDNKKTVNIYCAATDNPQVGKPGDLRSVRVFGRRADGSTGLLSRVDYEYDARGRQYRVKRYRSVPDTTDFSASDGSQVVSPAFDATTGDVLVSAKVRVDTTEYQYDLLGRVHTTVVTPDLQETGSVSYTTKNFYDGLGRLAKTTDAYGYETSYLYNSNGQVVQTSLPDGSVTRTVYDVNGKAIFSQSEYTPASPSTAAAPYVGDTTSAGARTVYDGFGRVYTTLQLARLKIHLVASTQNGFTFYSASRVADAVVNNLVSYTETHYDALDRAVYRGELISSDGTQNTWSIRSTVYPTRDATDLITSSYVWQSLSAVGAPFSEATGTPSEFVSAQAVDSAGRALWSQDSAQNKTYNVYRDPSGHDTPWVQQLIQPAVSVVNNGTTLPTTQTPITITSYDNQGRRLKVTEPDGRTRSFTYDSEGKLASVANQLETRAQVSLYRYDEAGNTVWRRDALQRVLAEKYDHQGRRISRTWPTVRAGGLTTEYWSYDALVGGALAHQMLYTDLSGNVLKQQFDSRGRLTTETPMNATDTTLDRTFQYSYTYLTDFPKNLFAGWSEASSQGGQFRTISETSSSGVVRSTFQLYDSVGRLKMRAVPEGTLQYRYSTQRNRLVETMGYASVYGILQASGLATAPAPSSLNLDEAYSWDFVGLRGTCSDGGEQPGDSGHDDLHLHFGPANPCGLSQRDRF